MLAKKDEQRLPRISRVLSFALPHKRVRASARTLASRNSRKKVPLEYTHARTHRTKKHRRRHRGNRHTKKISTRRLEEKPRSGAASQNGTLSLRTPSRVAECHLNISGVGVATAAHQRRSHSWVCHALRCAAQHAAGKSLRSWLHGCRISLRLSSVPSQSVEKVDIPHNKRRSLGLRRALQIATDCRTGRIL